MGTRKRADPGIPESAQTVQISMYRRAKKIVKSLLQEEKTSILHELEKIIKNEKNVFLLRMISFLLSFFGYDFSDKKRRQTSSRKKCSFAREPLFTPSESLSYAVLPCFSVHL